MEVSKDVFSELKALSADMQVSKDMFSELKAKAVTPTVRPTIPLRNYQQRQVRVPL
jgi:hypothetical protein